MSSMTLLAVGAPDGPSTVELLVRLVFSLGLIVGLLWLAAKFARKNGGALKLPGFGKKDTSIKVIERHSLTKTASIAVVLLPVWLNVNTRSSR